MAVECVQLAAAYPELMLRTWRGEITKSFHFLKKKEITVSSRSTFYRAEIDGNSTLDC
jgi:hypothetical protein